MFLKFVGVSMKILVCFSAQDFVYLLIFLSVNPSFFSVLCSMKDKLTYDICQNLY